MSIPSYVSVPSSAIPIHPFNASLSNSNNAGPSQPQNNNQPSSTASASATPSAPRVPGPTSRRPSFPPPSAASSNPVPPPRKFGVPSTSSITSNVSDMLLNSLLPPNLPKIPGGSKGCGPGIPRELSTRREALSLPLVSNNFRRFVTKVGPCFWLQDRIEEVLYWRKPRWTWAWLMCWTCISFRPRLLLLLPSVSLVLLLLHIHERQQPLPSLLGVAVPPDGEIGTTRLPPADPTASGAAAPAMASSGSNQGKGGTAGAGTVSSQGNGPGGGSGQYSASTGEGDGGVPVPVVPPKEAESGVDYYMNLQAIQNLMGQVSDIYDYTVPHINRLTNPQPLNQASTFPLTPTHLIMALLLPSLLLPLLPPCLIPYLLLPLGIAPPMFFHPNLTQLVLSLPRNRSFLALRSKLEDMALTDALDDKIGRQPIGRVEVWENERLDPAIASKPPPNPNGPSTLLPPGAWSSRHLRAGERAPWIKVKSPDSLWLDQELLPARPAPGQEHTDGKSGGNKELDKTEQQVVLALRDSWEFIPSEEWKVDVCGLWSDMGTDEAGWVYSDDSWQNPATTSMTEAETASPADLKSGGGMPGLALRRVTRRRRWWRRVYQDGESTSSQ